MRDTLALSVLVMKKQIVDMSSMAYKIWITNGPQADICVTYANKDVDLRHPGFLCFVFDTSHPGFSVGKVEEKLRIACSGI